MSTDARQADRVQSVRNAWVNALRSEVLHERSIDLARIANVGQWIASYADADGSNAYPTQETLAILAGCTDETVSRAIKVLVAVGMLAKKRRPNTSTTYQLLMPVRRPDWAAHMHLFTETRQRRAYAARKAKAAAALDPEPVRGRGPDTVHSGVPEPVRGGVPGGSDTVRRRGRTPSVDGFRTPSVAGGTSTPPTSGRYPLPDQDTADLSPQPQVRAGTRGENDHSAPTNPPSNTAPPQPVDALAEFRRAREKIRGRRDTA